MFGHYWPALSVTARTWIELALAVPVVLWAGWPFFERCVASIRNRSPNMFTLIGSGVAAASGSSVVATIAPDLFPASFSEHGRVAVYFEAAAVIVSLPLLRSEARHVGKESVRTSRPRRSQTQNKKKKNT